jgi:fructose-specific phosphotransferase system IIC component
MTNPAVNLPTAGSLDRPALPTVSIRELLPFLIFGGLLLLMGIYFVGAEQGATSMIGGSYVHEFVHDGRHLLGFPCH